MLFFPYKRDNFSSCLIWLYTALCANFYILGAELDLLIFFIMCTDNSCVKRFVIWYLVHYDLRHFLLDAFKTPFPAGLLLYTSVIQNWYRYSQKKMANKWDQYPSSMIRNLGNYWFVAGLNYTGYIINFIIIIIIIIIIVIIIAG